MDRGGVDDDAQRRRRSRGQLGRLVEQLGRGLLGGRACRDPPQRPDRVRTEVGAVGRRDAAVVEHRDERLGGGERVGGRVEHDRREVEQHAVERGVEVLGGEAGAELEPQRRGAAVEVDERGLVGQLGVGAVEVGADVPVAGPGRAAGWSRARRGPRRCPAAGPRCRRAWSRLSFSHTRESASSSPSRRALRSTAAADFSQSALVQRSPGIGQLERALFGLELGRLGQAALDFSHGANDRSVGRSYPLTVMFSTAQARRHRASGSAQGPVARWGAGRSGRWWASCSVGVEGRGVGRRDQEPATVRTDPVVASRRAGVDIASAPRSCSGDVAGRAARGSPAGSAPVARPRRRAPRGRGRRPGHPASTTGRHSAGRAGSPAPASTPAGRARRPHRCGPGRGPGGRSPGSDRPTP